MKPSDKETPMLWVLKPHPRWYPLNRDNYKIDGKSNPWEPWYDKLFRCVVRADSEAEARRVVSESGEASGTEYAWSDPNFTTCEELSGEGLSGIIVTDVAEA